jgi:hypothetical protein
VADSAESKEYIFLEVEYGHLRSREAMGESILRYQTMAEHSPRALKSITRMPR